MRTRDTPINASCSRTLTTICSDVFIACKCFIFWLILTSISREQGQALPIKLLSSRDRLYSAWRPPVQLYVLSPCQWLTVFLLFLTGNILSLSVKSFNTVMSTFAVHFQEHKFEIIGKIWPINKIAKCEGTVKVRARSYSLSNFCDNFRYQRYFYHFN